MFIASSDVTVKGDLTVQDLNRSSIPTEALFTQVKRGENKCKDLSGSKRMAIDICGQIGRVCGNQRRI